MTAIVPPTASYKDVAQKVEALHCGHGRLELAILPLAVIVLPVGVFCAWASAIIVEPVTAKSTPSLEPTNALNAAGFATFEGAHLLALAVSWAGIVAGLEILRRFVFNAIQRRDWLASKRPWAWLGDGANERSRSRWLWAAGVWHVVWVAAIWQRLWLGAIAGAVRRLSGELPFESMIRDVIELASGGDPKFERAVLHALHAKLVFGAQSGLVAAVLLGFAAAAIGYRWANIGVDWYDPAGLSRQRSWLIGLFVLASALLVVSAAALRAAQDWPLVFINPDGSTDGPKLVDVAKALNASSTSLWGEMAATLLIAAFAPAFWGLSRDIKEAAEIGLVCEKLMSGPKRAGAFRVRPTVAGAQGGLCDAHEVEIEPAPAAAAITQVDALAEGDIRAVIDGTTYAEIKTWNEDHGLDLSVGQIATALIAAAAPLLASPIIDFSKYVTL